LYTCRHAAAVLYIYIYIYCDLDIDNFNMIISNIGFPTRLKQNLIKHPVTPALIRARKRRHEQLRASDHAFMWLFGGLPQLAGLNLTQKCQNVILFLFPKLLER
jgi:hypothetical protein